MTKKLSAALALAAAASALSAAPAPAQDPVHQEVIDCTFRAMGTYTDCEDITVGGVVTLHTAGTFADVGDANRELQNGTVWPAVNPVLRAVLGDDPCNPAGVRICL